MSDENLLIVADSDRDANMLHAVGMFISDPFVYLRLKGQNQIVVSDVEFNRARKEARHCRVIPMSRCHNRLKQRMTKIGLAEIIHDLLKSRRLRQVHVPNNFPLGLALQLKRLKIQVKPKPGPFFPARELKTPAEVKKISAALLMAEVGLAEGIQALKSARVGKNRKLYYHNVPLTSEKLRAIIGAAILQAGGLACHTIAAGGHQACDPHEQGHGVLRAHEPIVLDVFPRSQKTGYFGDITRTVVKGRASEAVRKLYHSVEKAQEIGLKLLKAKTAASHVHAQVQTSLETAGYKTSHQNGLPQGFFHSTGHGLGLEIHESPRIGHDSRDLLRAGHVVTIEPGLYYSHLGAVRLEDVALVTRNGPRNLTKFEKILEI